MLGMVLQEIENNNYNIKKEFDSKSSSIVLLIECKLLLNTKQYVLKKTHRTIHEYKLIKELKHSNIIRSIGLTSHGLVLEYYSCLDLFDFITYQKFKPNKTFTLTNLNLFDQIVKAVTYLHKNRIAHRDIKSENILIHPDTKQIKLIDFEFAIKVPVTNVIAREYVGTPSYMAPELISSKKIYPFKTDIWALAILLYELIYKNVPWSEPTIDDIKFYEYYKTYKTNLPDVIFKNIDDLPKNISNTFKSCLELKPKRRPTIEELQTYLTV